MRIDRTDPFKKAFANLEDTDKRRAEKALRFLEENLGHPSLRVKRVRKTRRIWEARVSRDIRMTFEFQGEIILLRNIGRHDEILDSP